MPAMKLIMERWEGYLNEALKPCPQQAVDIDTFMTSLELAMMDPDVRKEKIEALKASKGRVEKLDQIFELVGLIGGIPAVAASAGVALGAAFVGLLAQAWRGRQESQTDADTHKLLVLLCIDEALLDTIDNDVEQLYWANSDIRQEVEDMISRARANPQPDPMPDFTSHLVKWLNTDSASPYAKTGTKGADTDIVER